MLVKGATGDTFGYTIECPFLIDEGHVQCLANGMELFLYLAGYGVGGAASRREAKLHDMM